jgi:hypothetical protein
MEFTQVRVKKCLDRFVQTLFSHKLHVLFMLLVIEMLNEYIDRVTQQANVFLGLSDVLIDYIFINRVQILDSFFATQLFDIGV